MSAGEKSLGERVRELRERQGLTQAQLAKRAQLCAELARALGIPSKVLTDLAE